MMDKNTLIALAKNIYQLTLLFPKKEPLRYKLREASDGLIFEFIMKENDYAGKMRRIFEVMESYLEIAAAQDWVAPVKIAEVENENKRIKQELDEIEPISSAKSESAACQNNCVAPKNETLERSAPIIGKDFVLVPEKEMVSELVSPPPRDLMAPENSAALAIVEIFAANEQTAPAESGVGGERTALTASQIARQNRIMEFLKEKGRAQVWEIQNIFPRVSKRTIRRDFCSMMEQGLIERTGERNTTAYKPKVNLA
jgi:hypothetical protein